MPYIPKVAWYLAGGILVIVALYFASEWLEAAAMLPGVGGL